uniref:Ig-like domain-containing protein n=1 Tax=Jaculus jaculus TaxID=51337 RepID=A0A8C5KB80_JACJA
QQENLSFHILHIASFANHSWAHAEGSGWLGELQVHVWDSVTGTIRFLKPWSQVKPEAWLSSSPGPGHDHLRLACHVSGFYPKPVWVMWVMGEQEQKGTQRGDTLPNADGTWYLRATLDVEAGKAAGLACQVKHSSLGGRDIVLYW